mmetsp:Transcript_11301/g.41904  ORF Transcript_11301/g.41904 Transcript_11301/m.41904 type:complete len:304 (+) Transcript_11301:750-1661(+)
MPILIAPVYPAFSIASFSNSRPSLFSWMFGANPPSSPTLHASWPYFALITVFRWWYTSLPMRMASENDFAPTGRIMNSCMASLFPACEPPLITLNAGTGSTSFPFPARSAMCLYRGTPFSAAPALETAIDTAKIAFAPSLPLFLVPSSSIIRSSMVFCSVGSLPISAGPRMVLMFSTAFVTPLPIHLALSPSRSSTASWMPVEAPLGVIARNMPLCVYTSASTVGFPLLSKICLPTILVIAAGVCFRRYSAMNEMGSGALALTAALITSSTFLPRACSSMYSWMLMLSERMDRIRTGRRVRRV